MYLHSAPHPLDTDLLDLVEGALDITAARAIEAHLAGCVLCRIKRQRMTGMAPIALRDVRDLAIPGFGTIEIEDAPGAAAQQGELWLTASDEATMVLVRSVRSNDYGVVVVPVTLDIEVADSGTLILEESVSPIGVPLVIYDHLVVSLPSAALSGRIIPVHSDFDLLALVAGDPGVSRGSALEGPADPRLEVRQYLSDRLVALDPYEPEDAGDDPLLVDGQRRLVELREAVVFRCGPSCEVEKLATLPGLAQTPQTWSGVAWIREARVRVVVIDTPAGLNDDSDYVCAQALLTRLDGSGLAVCNSLSDFVDLYDAPTLFQAFVLPDCKRTTEPLISGVSLVDAVAKFLEQRRIMVPATSTAGRHAVRVDARDVLAEQVTEAVEANIRRASRFGPDKREGYMALGGLGDGLKEVLKGALEANFDPQSIVALADGDDS